ncbi:MAG TPA: PaaI family thioesterase [Thermomicrobiales bacterium]|jgi:uncharacterized protein (TIGR00369 family)|nr:PaaI family thioesterase [Chloroflexota bacterium]HBY46048.1 PaaI family thioesterase [Chloroflexota bacterium]HCG29706.1 PaaI family thioesterase [Chloroflexota bacterium]HQZ88475.1 PaaI family thioesterase [Thermomicrobiales bacterium]HRA30395.1 PaaI family thioesterase [Thermomicrobiales bacterium]
MSEPWDASASPINEDTIGHHCFGCGGLNPIGLRLRFRPLEGGGVWAEFTPAREHEGYLGMVHGGISATILDEAMNWAVTNEGDIAVTARMAVTYRRPLAVGRRVRVTARIDERRSRAIDTRAEIRQVDTEELLAEAEGRFMRVSAAQAEAWRDSYGMQYDDSPFADAARRTASANR